MRPKGLFTLAHSLRVQAIEAGKWVSPELLIFQKLRPVYENVQNSEVGTKFIKLTRSFSQLSLLKVQPPSLCLYVCICMGTVAYLSGECPLGNDMQVGVNWWVKLF